MKRPLIFLIGVACAAALAGDGTAYASRNTAGTGIFLAFAFAYLTRRRRIGGWLFYFYLQLYTSALLGFVALPAAVAMFSPSKWDSANLYVWYLLSTAPVLVLQLVEIAVATLLLVKPSEAMVHLLRRVLAALAVCAAGALAIDGKYFAEDSSTLVYDGFTLTFACIWFGYFVRSRRVRMVLIENQWSYEALRPPRPALTAPEKRYLSQRAALVAVATFVLLLVSMGTAMGDKAPDVGMFFVPLFYAGIAAVIGWYLPIRKSKRAALVGLAVPPGKQVD